MKDLTDSQRVRIVCARMAGASVTETARMLEVSRGTVSKVMNAFEREGKMSSAKHRSGRKSKLSEKDRQTLDRIVREDHKTRITEITTDLNKHLQSPVSTRTVRRVLHKSGFYSKDEISQLQEGSSVRDFRTDRRRHREHQQSSQSPQQLGHVSETGDGIQSLGNSDETVALTTMTYEQGRNRNNSRVNEATPPSVAELEQRGAGNESVNLRSGNQSFDRNSSAVTARSPLPPPAMTIMSSVEMDDSNNQGDVGLSNLTPVGV